MEDKNQVGKLNWMQEFTDKQLEREYTQNAVIGSLKYARFTVFALGILYFLFIFADYFLVSSPQILLLILLNRTLVCLGLFIFYCILHRSRQYHLFYYLYSVGEVVASLAFLGVCRLYEDPNYLVQTLGLIVILMIVFMLPNYWIGRVITAFIIMVGFNLYGLLSFSNIKTSELSAAIVYPLLIIILRAVGSYNNEYHRKMLFLNGKKLEQLSKIDPMTGIYNRATLNVRIDAAIADCSATEDTFTLAIFDIDDFKAINDRFGHLMGDRVLIDIVETVRENLSETDMLFRWGGEEFILLLCGVPLEQAVAMLEGYRLQIEELYYPEGIEVTCSFGVAQYRQGDDLDTLIARADEKLYLAKTGGKNRIEV